MSAPNALRLVTLVGAWGAAAGAVAHHGVAGLGAAGLEGPGAPVEAATSSTLPAGSTLLYLKLDHAKYETYDRDPANPEGDYANYWMTGVGYGFTPWFSGYAFLPYHSKVDEDGGYDTHGWADASLFAQVGFKFDEGLGLNPGRESLDDLEDWHFTVFAGVTFPTGEADLRDRAGTIDPGKSTGFGENSYSAGVTATKMFSQRWTFNAELSGIWFEEHEYADGNRTEFGTETRLNTALAYRAHTDPGRSLRLDLVGELQYLGLGRDRSNGMDERATGGDMVYFMPGVRLYWDRLSIAAGVKAPVWTDLNEEDEQQGAEGKEDYRLVFSLSYLF